MSGEKRTKRVTSAPPQYIRLKPVFRSVDKATLNHVKKSASQAWKTQIQKEKDSVTTYSGFHVSKSLDEPTQNRVRPSSQNRINKPHPANVFLVTRLNEIEGCFAPQEAAVHRYGDAARGNLDKYLFEHKGRLRKGERARPLQRPHTCLEPSYDGKVKMQTIMGQVPQHSTEAWTKMQSRVSVTEKARRAVKFLKQQSHPLVKTTVIYKDGVPFHILSYDKHVVDSAKQPFYDFQIHPEWHMPWHKRYEKTLKR